MHADVGGFGPLAAARRETDDRQALRQLCRYTTPPALAEERVQTNAVGEVALKLHAPERNGSMHLPMSPLAFRQRLVAPAP